MATSIWNDRISFGMVSFPVKLYAAARSQTISFNQLHQCDHSRVKQVLYCQAEDKPDSRSELVRGFEYEKDCVRSGPEGTLQWFMKSIKLSLTLDELKGLLQTVQNQLFHVKYLDPRIPGYKAQPGELKAAESAVRVLEEAIKQDRLRTPGAWESPVRFGHPTPAK